MTQTNKGFGARPAKKRLLGATLSAQDVEKLNSLEKINFTGSYKDDFGSVGWVHPLRDNEALAFVPDMKVWAILDCTGGVTSFPSFSSAYDEFVCPFGHADWVDLRTAGQHLPSRYFAV